MHYLPGGFKHFVDYFGWSQAQRISLITFISFSSSARAFLRAICFRSVRHQTYRCGKSLSMQNCLTFSHFANGVSMADSDLKSLETR